jgi:two-component system, chemotaxis family, sensor kinase CheA
MSKKTILIVEDEATLHKALLEFLTPEGYATLSAVDGEQAVEIAKEKKPDLILLDIILPKKDGYEVLEELKKDANTKDIPVIILTNLESPEDVQRALDIGATNYLVKADFKLEEVINKIKQVLEKEN